MKKNLSSWSAKICLFIISITLLSTPNTITIRFRLVFLSVIQSPLHLILHNLDESLSKMQTRPATAITHGKMFKIHKRLKTFNPRSFSTASLYPPVLFFSFFFLTSYHTLHLSHTKILTTPPKKSSSPCLQAFLTGFRLRQTFPFICPLSPISQLTFGWYPPPPPLGILPWLLKTSKCPMAL